MLRAVPLLLGLLAASSEGRAHEVLAAVRADRWIEADALAAQHPDPVARKVVLHARLLAPGAARAGEIADFMAANPDWPQQALLSRRLQDAIAAEGDDGAVLKACARQAPQAPAPLLRCADAAARAARPLDAARSAREAWRTGITDPAAESAFLRQWGRVLTDEDHQARFDRLAWTDNGAMTGPAARQAGRLDPQGRALAGARLALKRDEPSASALVAVLPAAQRSDSGLVLDHAKWLRRAGAGADALALAVWTGYGAEAERAAPPDRKPAFWDERNLLARRLLRQGNADGAYALASQHAQLATEQVADAEFLAGFIALRRLARPDAATAHFEVLTSVSKAAITQGRAQYWLGRAATARADAEAARAAYAAAAAWPTTFYGQLAARAGGDDDAALAERLLAVRDPAWTPGRALEFAGAELARAAAILAAWGDARRARPFLLRLDETAPEAADRSLAARLALALGLPDQAVAIARRAGRDGLMLPDAGWPLAFSPPDTGETAVALGLMRQESSFDVQAGSPVGARGLMQLMPATATGVARRLGEPVSLPALTADAAYNMRLGTAYLRGLLDQFGGVLPFALAGYNAGPSRVLDWVATNGDPAAGQLDMVDWIELIPFSETRNYVQRVIENVVIYRARQGRVMPHPLARWQG